MRAKIKITACGITKSGMRAVNQDVLFLNGKMSPENSSVYSAKTGLITAPPMLFAVFDGMGGEENGEKAAFMAASEIKNLQNSFLDEANFESAVKDYTNKINKKICDECAHNQKRMGTTYVLLGIFKNFAACANIGDSKCFLVRDGKLLRLSSDHNCAAQMVKAGIISEDEARIHESKSKLTQHLGINPDEMLLAPHFERVEELYPGDCFILCSDGLTDGLSYDGIAAICGNYSQTPKLAEALFETALEGGSKDNITVMSILIK